MEKIRPGFILPSAAYTLTPRHIRGFARLDRKPRVGDVVYGKIAYIGAHSALENKQGRIHQVYDGTRAVFVYGNRYAPDYFEGFVPERFETTVDLLARSGLIGEMREKNSGIKDPTKVELLGFALDGDGRPLNTTEFPLAVPKKEVTESRGRAKMILHVGTSMNAGKSTSATATCWALAAAGHTVRGSKVTGTASLKDILHMQDAGAEKVSDFTYLGYPSTYMLEYETVLDIFRKLDAKYANNPSRYWVVEFADGILQRETAALLRDEYVRSRIHRVIFSATDSFAALGGLRTLEEEFGIVPHAVSGRCTASPLMLRELRERTQVPIFDNVVRNLRQLTEILI